mmetsp:Transcript_24494/g.28358  ORF Transcript_24494/g.28358 Transcript_24494/m.28358 type:complete len:195 (-) Transcript_24494:619-1203(-)
MKLSADFRPLTLLAVLVFVAILSGSSCECTTATTTSSSTVSREEQQQQQQQQQEATTTSLRRGLQSGSLSEDGDDDDADAAAVAIRSIFSFVARSIPPSLLLLLPLITAWMGNSNVAVFRMLIELEYPPGGVEKKQRKGRARPSSLYNSTFCGVFPGPCHKSTFALIGLPYGLRMWTSTILLCCANDHVCWEPP